MKKTGLVRPGLKTGQTKVLDNQMAGHWTSQDTGQAWALDKVQTKTFENQDTTKTRTLVKPEHCNKQE